MDSDILNNLQNLQQQVNDIKLKIKNDKEIEVQQKNNNANYNLGFLSNIDKTLLFFLLSPILIFITLLYLQPSIVVYEIRMKDSFFVEKKIHYTSLLATTIVIYLFLCLSYFIFVTKVMILN